MQKLSLDLTQQELKLRNIQTEYEDVVAKISAAQIANSELREENVSLKAVIGRLTETEKELRQELFFVRKQSDEAIAASLSGSARILELERSIDDLSKKNEDHLNTEVTAIQLLETLKEVIVNNLQYASKSIEKVSSNGRFAIKYDYRPLIMQPDTKVEICLLTSSCIDFAKVMNDATTALNDIINSLFEANELQKKEFEVNLRELDDVLKDNMSKQAFIEKMTKELNDIKYEIETIQNHKTDADNQLERNRKFIHDIVDINIDFFGKHSSLVQELPIKLEIQLRNKDCQLLSLSKDAVYKALSDYPLDRFRNLLIKDLGLLYNDIWSELTGIVSSHRACATRVEFLERELDKVQNAKESASNAIIVANNNLQRLLTSAESEIKKLSEQTESLKAEKSTLLLANEELRDNFSKVSTSNEEACSSITQLEQELKELRARDINFRAEADAKDREITKMTTELENYRKRITNYELHVEKATTMSNRLRAEKEALDSVVLSMQAEIDRSRLDHSSLVKQKQVIDNFPQFLTEFQRVMESVNTLITQYPSEHVSFTGESFHSEEFSSSFDRNLEICKGKAKAMVSSIGQVVYSIREEKQRLRILESKNYQCDEQIRQLKVAVDDLTIRLHQKEIEFESSKSAPDNSKVDNLVLRLKDSENQGKDLLHQLDNLRVELQQAKNSLSEQQWLSRDKDAKIAMLQRDLASYRDSLQTLTEQRELEKNNYLVTLKGYEKDATQLDSSKENCEKMIVCIKQLENSLQIEQETRLNLENKCQELEKTLQTQQQTRDEIRSLGAELEKIRLENKAMIRAKASAEEHCAFMEQEIASLQRMNTSLEQRINLILEEKNIFLDKISETQLKIQEAKALKVNERQRINVVKVEDRQKNTIMYNEVTPAVQMDNNYRATVEQLALELEEKEAKLVYEEKRRNAVEKDLEAIKISHTKLLEDSDKLKDYVSSFRSEARDARKQILDVIGQLLEHIHSFNLEVKMSVVQGEVIELDVSNPLDAATSETIRLTEALGLKDISVLAKHLKQVVSTYRAQIKRTKQLSQSSDRSRAEVMQLLEKIRDLENVGAEKESRYRAEVRSWQDRCDYYKHFEEQFAALRSKLDENEARLKNESAAKDRALLEIEKLHNQIVDYQTVATPSLLKVL